MEKNIFTRILVPIDGSKCSMEAAKYAIDLAEKYHSELIVVHMVYYLSSHDYSNLIGLATPNSIQLLLDNAKKHTESWFETITRVAREKNPTLKIKTDVVSAISSIHGEIINYAENKKVGLIVIGSRGKTGIKKMLMGSTASGVVTYAHCPVLVVK